MPKTKKAVKRKAGVHLGLRLTADDYALLHEIIATRNKEAERHNLPASVTASWLVRMWIAEEATRLGLVVQS